MRTREWALFAFSWMDDTADFIFTMGSSRRPGDSQNASPLVGVWIRIMGKDEASL